MAAYLSKMALFAQALVLIISVPYIYLGAKKNATH